MGNWDSWTKETSRLTPNYDEPVKLVHIDPCRIFAVELDLMFDKEYQARHKERMSKIAAIQEEDRQDANEVMDKYYKEKYGMSFEEADEKGEV